MFNAPKRAGKCLVMTEIVSIAGAIRSRSRLFNWLAHLVQVNPNEIAAVAWSWLYIFSIFLAYYVLRPIRDELGISGGVNNLPWLFTGTLVAMIVVSPLFSWLVKCWPRERFIAVAYRFFMLNLALFVVLLSNAGVEQQVWIGRAFFIWVSVFNLFVISVFWSFVVDVFNGEQAKRLFGLLATGATLGGLAGSALTSGLVDVLGHNWLAVISIVLLEVAVLATRRLSMISDAFKRPLEQRDEGQPLGGSVLAGILRTFRSPYLIGISLFILCYSATSTILYFQQATIVESNFTDRAARIAFFANINLWVNGLTLVIQLFMTGRIMGWIGVTFTLCALPLISMFGFASMAAFPTLAVFLVLQVARNVSNYALTRPAREVLFTAVTREDRYKTKNFIDTVVYRSGDQIAAWGYAGLLAIGLSFTAIAMLAVPLSALWLALAFLLGRTQRKWEQQQQTPVS